MSAPYTFGFQNSNGVTSFADDFYAYQLDDVSITIIPASEANSAENNGIRVDGLDKCSIDISGILAAEKGTILFKWVPRHSAADPDKFGQPDAFVFRVVGDSVNEIYVYWKDPNTLRMVVDTNGTTGANWDCTGAIVANTTYQVKIKYNATNTYLYIDNVLKITVTRATNFSPLLATAYMGSTNGGLSQSDAVFK